MLHNSTAAVFTEIAVTPSRKPDIQLHTLRDDPCQRYYLYLPRITAGARVFVTVHGISRNAEEHARLFAPFAERYGVVLVAPLFPANRFTKYQQLGKAGDGKRADQALHQILSEVGTLTGAAIDRLYLFGFSGGGNSRTATPWPILSAWRDLSSARRGGIPSRLHPQISAWYQAAT